MIHFNGGSLVLLVDSDSRAFDDDLWSRVLRPDDSDPLADNSKSPQRDHFLRLHIVL